ncbi:hypothetical protein BY458DRAFT_504960 [Sporodiniella umbellata]|nr:hypothetical protein BY458DRAFT_504960 [Sporodiniella umbellata]
MSQLSFEHFDPEYELCVDDQGKPIKPRKKPGRKPNPPSPAQRKAQNRAAQRAFRERKRREIKEAETNNQRYLEMHQEALNHIERLQSQLDSLKYENDYLKGQLLTYKITCMAHRVDVPKFWDAGCRDSMGSEIALCSQSKDLPQPMEFFLDKNRKIVTENLEGCIPGLASTLTSYMISPALSSLIASPSSLLSSPRVFSPVLSEKAVSVVEENEKEPWLGSDLTQLLDVRHLFTHLTDAFHPSPVQVEEKVYVAGPLSPLEAISKMRMTKEEGGYDYLLTPTELQRRVPHDARIDLIPGPNVRDLMIVFQDYYDSNELFNYLIEHAVFIGGELANPDCWFVPPEFISRYWFFCPSYHPARYDNSVETAISYSQKLLQSLKQRKEMYIRRDQHHDAFPPPSPKEDLMKDDHQGYTLESLVIQHINNDVPKIISTV